MFFSLVPVIMDEVKRVKIVVTDTTYDFYMRKGTDKDQCFNFFRESELAMICQNLFLKSVYFQSLNINV